MDDEQIIELVIERAAIMQYDGEIKPDTAFKMAFFEIKRVHKIGRMPEILCEELQAVMERLLK
jgi:hypothetical protein